MNIIIEILLALTVNKELGPNYFITTHMPVMAYMSLNTSNYDIDNLPKAKATEPSTVLSITLLMRI